MDEVEDMGNIIKSEFLKLKRYYVVKAGIIMTVLSPLLTLFYSTANDGQTWTFDYFMQQVMISNCTLFFPIIITLIAGANSHFLRPAGPHFPASQGHIKRPVLEIGRAERGLRPANQYRALSQKAMLSQSVR